MLRDAPEGGALFVVDLPLRRGGAPAEDKRRPMVDVAERQRTTVERLRAELIAPRSGGQEPALEGDTDADVLVVTSDAQLGDYLYQLIGSRYRVHHAADGLEGGRGEPRRPDVVLLDADVGSHALAMLRRRLAGVPILAFAAAPRISRPFWRRAWPTAWSSPSRLRTCARAWRRWWLARARRPAARR